MSGRVSRVVMAADDGYAMPLAVTGRSVIRHLDSTRSLELYVFDTGISPANREKIDASFRAPRVTVHWITGIREVLDGLPTHGWFSTAAYARLLIPDFLPQEVDRALYIDCDLVVRRCIGDLYDSDMNEAIALAAPDQGAAYIACPWGVGGWFDLGRQASDFNFNTGVMLLDLAAWRRDRIGQAAIEYARANTPDTREHPINVDQEALNATAGNRIRTFDPRWNQQGELFNPANACVLPYPRETILSLRQDPWVIHYSTGSKPWHLECTHPWLAEWFVNLDDTDYRGWRPPTPGPLVSLARKARRFAGSAARQLGI
jgi:lipopolysaccharide biosynthesis glycosyltransferase